MRLAGLGSPLEFLHAPTTHAPSTQKVSISWKSRGAPLVCTWSCGAVDPPWKAPNANALWCRPVGGFWVDQIVFNLPSSHPPIHHLKIRVGGRGVSLKIKKKISSSRSLCFFTVSKRGLKHSRTLHATLESQLIKYFAQKAPAGQIKVFNKVKL